MADDMVLVKVQLARKESPDEPDLILMFSEDGEVTYEGELTEDVRALLNGRQTAYFRGRVLDGDEFRIVEEAEDPGWEGEDDADV